MAVDVAGSSQPQTEGVSPSFKRFEVITLTIQGIEGVLTLVGLYFIYATLSTTQTQLVVSNRQIEQLIAQTDASQKQTEQLIKQTNLTTLLGALNYTLELDRIFIQNPELRQYFYEGKSVVNGDRDYRLALAVAEIHLDVFSYALIARERLPAEHPFPAETETWITDMIKASPIIRSYLIERKQWYTKVFELAGPKININPMVKP